MRAKRPMLESPEQGAGGEMSSPRKRLRMTVLVVNVTKWLERARVRGLMMRLIRLMKEEFAKIIFVVLGMLLLRVDMIERLMNERLDTIQRLFLWRLDTMQSLFLGRLDTMQRTMEETRANQLEQNEFIRRVQEQRIASPTNRLHAPPVPPLNPVEAASEGLNAVADETGVVQLRFLSSPNQLLYTEDPITAGNETVKIGIFKDGKIITSGDLSSVDVEILPIEGDYSVRGQENFSAEGFDRRIIRARDKQGSVLAGDLVRRLEKGVASLDCIKFKDCSRGEKVRLAVRVLPSVHLPFRVQEGMTDPFTVQVCRNKSNEKHYPPLLEDPVNRLKEIGPRYRNILGQKKIHTVQDLLKYYYKDESGLQKLIGLKGRTWLSMIEHAKTCDPGDDLYSFCIPGKNVVLFFNGIYSLVGAKFGDSSYTAYKDLSPDQQVKVNKWKKGAYDKLDRVKPDYTMTGNVPEPNDGAGPSMSQTQVAAEVGPLQPSTGHNELCCATTQRNARDEQGFAAPQSRTSPQAEGAFVSDKFAASSVDAMGASTTQNSQPHRSDNHPDGAYLANHQQCAEDNFVGWSPPIPSEFDNLMPFETSWGASTSQNLQSYHSDNGAYAAYRVDHQPDAQENVLGRPLPIAESSYGGDYLSETLCSAMSVPMAAGAAPQSLPNPGPEPTSHEGSEIQTNNDIFPIDDPTSF